MELDSDPVEWIEEQLSSAQVNYRAITDALDRRRFAALTTSEYMYCLGRVLECAAMDSELSKNRRFVEGHYGNSPPVFEDAIDAYKAALRADPCFGPAQKRLGIALECYLEAPVEAVSILGAYVRQFESDSEGVYHLARALASNGEGHAGIEILDSFIHKYGSVSTDAVLQDISQLKCEIEHDVWSL